MRDRDLERRSECEVGREDMLGASSKDSCEERSASAGALEMLLPSVPTSSLPEVFVLLLSGREVRSSIAEACRGCSAVLVIGNECRCLSPRQARRASV
jgi:hypothetical protein